MRKERTVKRILQFLLVSVVLSFSVSGLYAAEENDLNQAVAKAKQSNKLVFIIFGREACGNCQHLKKMIKDGSVKISSSEFIIADINCDDKNQSAAFYERYSVSGNYLPFVVIAKPDGTKISSRSGYGEAAEYNKLIQDSRK